MAGKLLIWREIISSNQWPVDKYYYFTLEKPAKLQKHSGCQQKVRLQANYINALAVSVLPLFEPAKGTLGGFFFSVGGFFNDIG
jgi:hypothetical protein